MTSEVRHDSTGLIERKEIGLITSNYVIIANSRRKCKSAAGRLRGHRFLAGLLVKKTHDARKLTKSMNATRSERPHRMPKCVINDVDTCVLLSRKILQKNSKKNQKKACISLFVLL